MAGELQPLDISQSDEVRRLVEEVQAADRACALQVDHKTVAILVPAYRRHSPSRRGKATSVADPLWTIVGVARSDGPGDIAENVEAYLVQAMLPREG